MCVRFKNPKCIMNPGDYGVGCSDLPGGTDRTRIHTLALGRLCWLQWVSNLQLGTMDCNLLDLTGDLQDT